MQHKHKSSRGLLFLGLVALAVVVGGISLMRMDIPAPQQQMVEKELDAKTFLGTQ